MVLITWNFLPNFFTTLPFIQYRRAFNFLRAKLAISGGRLLIIFERELSVSN